MVRGRSGVNVGAAAVDPAPRGRQDSNKVESRLLIFTSYLFHGGCLWWDLIHIKACKGESTAGREEK
ncbi:unnamed protein product [Caretta caretta]